MTASYLVGRDDAAQHLSCVDTATLLRRARVHFSLRQNDYWRGYVDALLTVVC